MSVNTNFSLKNTTFSLGALSAAPGEKVQGYVTIPGTSNQFPITIINGREPGRTALVSCGVHSCEYVGIEAVIQLSQEVVPEMVKGCLVLIHPVNLSGFNARIPSLVAEDLKNLNRVFPGDPNGTVSERIAAFMVQELYPQLDFMMDMHCGGIYEELSPYIYYMHPDNEEVAHIAQAAAFMVDMPYMVRSRAKTGAYNCAANNGIPSILYERGCNGKWTEGEVLIAKKDITNVLRFIEVLEGETTLPNRIPVELMDPTYLCCNQPGLWYPMVHAGEVVRKGQLLGIMKDYFGKELDRYYAEFEGIVLYLTSTLRVDGSAEIITYAPFYDEESDQHKMPHPHHKLDLKHLAAHLRCDRDHVHAHANHHKHHD